MCDPPGQLRWLAGFGTSEYDVPIIDILKVIAVYI